MGSQFEQLRAQANTILDFNSATNFVKNNTSNMIDELLVHQLELELQNIHLIETQVQLEESRNKYAELYDLAPIGYFTIDQKGLIVDLNIAGSELLGIRKAMLLNRSFSRYIAPESQPIFSENRQRAFKKMVFEPCELKLLKRDGPLFYAKVDGRVIQENNSVKLLMIISDITFHKKTEKIIHQKQLKISHADRRSSTSEFATMLIHEINQPLSVIANYIYGCIRRLESGTFDKAKIILAMKQAAQQLSRSSDIILRMNNFFSKGKLEFQLVCIHSMLEEVILLLNYETQDFPVNIVYQQNRSVTKTLMDKLHIQQVILHLARNAVEAMRDADIADAKLIIQVNQLSIDQLEICIIDNGPGFSKDSAHRLFEPNFTTKHYGIGLGLSVSRSLIESHGGKILAELNLTYGACFRLTLPIRTE